MEKFENSEEVFVKVEVLAVYYYEVGQDDQYLTLSGLNRVFTVL